MIVRHGLLNLAALALPLLVGLFTVPLIVAALGTERFGALTLVWAVTGYVGVFDLGIGRALTHRVAILATRPARLRAAARLGLTLLLGLGLVLAAALLATALAFDYRRFALGETEFLRAALLLAASVPPVLLSGGLRGVLEGQQRFVVVAAVRLGFGLLTFVAPVFALPVAPGLDGIVAILLVGRLLGCLVLLLACRTTLGGAVPSGRRRWVEARRLLGFGGWVTFSNLVSALMLYLDRFWIAASGHAPALAFYTTPYEFVTRLFIVPSALSGVLFPAMTRARHAADAGERLLGLGCGLVLLTVAPVASALVLFAEPLLGLWLGAAFAAHAATPLRILAVGVLLNCLAQIFQTALLSRGEARWMARLHACELLGYLPALAVALPPLGIAGAAWVWTLRVTVDALAMAARLRGALARQGLGGVLGATAGGGFALLLAPAAAAPAVWLAVTGLAVLAGSACVRRAMGRVAACESC